MLTHKGKEHNISLLLYHLVCPAKCRLEIFTPDVEQSLKDICLEISKRYEIEFIEIGADKDQVHFFIQSISTMSPKQIAQTIKSITAKELFKRHPAIRKILWGGAIWTKGYYVNTVGQYGNAAMIARYVKNQGEHYRQIHHGQSTLFPDVS